MRSSSILTLIGATLAMASPIHVNLHKKAIVWDVVTDVVYVTVTEGHLPKSHPETTVTVKHTHYVNPIPATTSKQVVPTTSTTPPPPPPPPSTSSTPPPPPATTQAPAPAPVTEVAAVSSAAPVVQSVAPVAAVAAGSGATPTDLSSGAVYYHNLARSNHSAPALAWSDSLASSAQILSDSCVYGHNMGINGGGYGQNIDMQGSSDPSASGWSKLDLIASAITNNWYVPEEASFEAAKLWGESNPQITTPEMRHFTQVVWKDTTTVGCGVTYCGQNLLGAGWYEWYIVCNYGPAGNYGGEYASNVGKTLKLKGPVVLTPFEKEQQN